MEMRSCHPEMIQRGVEPQSNGQQHGRGVCAEKLKIVPFFWLEVSEQCTLDSERYSGSEFSPDSGAKMN
jgi:hypothetical protein